MGKTSVSLAVAESPLVQERFQKGKIVWVPCIGATLAALLLETLYLQLQIPGGKQVTLEEVISKLSTSKDPRLILLDNFNTPWNAAGRTQTQVETILRQLALLKHIAIFVTMHGNHPPCNNAITWQSSYIQPTDEEACLRIFHQINPISKDNPDVSRLLTAVGHMPFAVTLMANLGKEAQWTAEELLNAWSESGPDIFSDDLEQSMNQSISLSVDSDLVRQNPNALLLLAILSSLPAGTTKQNLCWWARTLKTSMIPSAIATLAKAALVVEIKQQDASSSVLFVNPVVQSFMQQHGRISDIIQKQIHLSCCRYVLDHAGRYDDSAFPVKSKALADEDTNIQFILFCSTTTEHTDSFDITMEALIAFGWHRCDTKPSLEISSQIVTAAKASHIERHIASALWCLGRTYYQVSDYAPSYDHLQEAYQVFNTLPPDDLKLQQLGGQCGIDFVRTAAFISGGAKVISLAQDVERRCSTLSDDLIHGRSLILVGTALIKAQQTQEALHYINSALAMLRAVKSTSNLATAYQILACVHYCEQRLPEALDAMKEAWKQAEMSSSPYIQAVVSSEFGTILFSANKDTEAWKYIEIALMKASHVGSLGIAADALEYMGYRYLCQGDYQNAYQAYEAAAEKYPSGSAVSIQRCRDNMANIKQKERNPDVAIGFYRPDEDLDDSLFFPPCCPSVSG